MLVVKGEPKMAVETVFLNHFCRCLLVLLFSIETNGVQLTGDMVRQWANRIGNEAYNFTENMNGAKDLEKAYREVPFTIEDVKPSEVLTTMKREMEYFFSNKTNALKRLVAKAEEAYCNYKYNRNLKLSYKDYPNAKDLDQHLNETGLTLEYNSTFKTEISFNRSVIHVPTDVYDGAAEIVNGISWTEALDSVFDDNRHIDPSLSWQYFGSDKGFMRTYPAKHWNNNPGQVDLYDARRRPWFIQGATSPKNIIILIDASGSMHGVPVRIAKLSVQNLIDTFGDNDFFNIVYTSLHRQTHHNIDFHASFNSEAFVLCCPDDGPTLLQATKKNKIYAKSKLQEIEDGNVAVWRKGLEKAFDLLRKANSCSLCQEVIMVLSDGTTSSLPEVFEAQNKDRKVRVFTFAVGPPAESTQALHKMACDNRGYFSRIQSVGAVREVSENYIRVLTRPMAKAPKENVTDHTVWTSVYLDALGLGMMVTGTLPVFHRIKDSSGCSSKDGVQEEEKTKDHFLGVMGTDVPLDYLQGFVLQPLMGPNGYVYAINNNGMIISHPRLKTVNGYLSDPPGVDLADVELTENADEVLKLRTAMIDRAPLTKGGHSTGLGSQSSHVLDLSLDELRVVKRNMHYYFDGLEGTSFSLGMATPQPGYKYKASGHNSEEELGNLINLLKSEDTIRIERWPYCRNVVFSQGNPLDQLINETRDGSWNTCKNLDLLTGLLVDFNATAVLPALWSTKSDTYLQKNIKDVFVRTFFGLTRSYRSKLSSQGNFFGRVVGSDRSDTSIIYSSPYLAAKSENNISSIFAYQKISRNQRPMAVLGYEMDMDSFTSELFVRHTKCDIPGDPCGDLTCNRSGKDEYNGLYCYLLDENAFVVAANDESSAGKFFGRVDSSIMERLIRENENSSTGIYNKVVLTDSQAVCEEKAGVNSGGTSLGMKSLLSLSSYVDWWTTKAVWSVLYFNLYSWIFSETIAVTEAAEDIAKNVSCIKNITTYYATSAVDVVENGSTTCEGTSERAYAVASVPKSNLYLVVVDAICGKYSGSPGTIGIPGEPKENLYNNFPFNMSDFRFIHPDKSILRASVENSCKEPGYRKRPKRCFVSTDTESGYPCGLGCTLRPSIPLVTILLVSLQQLGPL